MYERIDELCKNSMITVTWLCRELKIGRSSLSELARGRSKSISAESTAKIADYFNVSPFYLTDGLPEEVEEHFIPMKVREEVKAENRNIIYSESSSRTEKYEAALIVIECLYSRSYQAQGYDPKHCSYDDYGAMLLHQEYFKKRLNPELYNDLVHDFGTKEGLEEGKTYAYIRTTVNPNELRYAAYQELEGESDDIVKDVIDFIKFKKSQKQKE
jgi:transcriptional regulator with XRE-family HTH domain